MPDPEARIRAALRDRHTNQMYRAVLSTFSQHCVLEEEFVFRRNKASNSADVGKDRQRAREHSHCSSLSARTNSTASLSFSRLLPFTLPLSDRSLLPLLLPSSIAEAGASKPATSYISAQLEHALHCCLSYSLPIKSNPPFAIHHPYRPFYPFHVRLHSHHYG
jgi:hypothetical protein